MTTPTKSETRHRVVIVGAGFGGLAAAKGLAGSDVEVTVVDQRNHHTFQPLLYQVATAGLDSDDICYATRGVFHRDSNVRAMQATVTGIDFKQHQVVTATGKPLFYDHLVLALGAVTADFGVPGVAEHAFGLKSAAEAMQIRNHVLRSFERAARLVETPERTAETTLVVVGGGPTGVEMAGGFAELTARVLRRDFPELDPSATRVILIEGQDRLLGSFKPTLGSKAAAQLEAMGVELRLGTQVACVTAESVELQNGDSIPTATVVWAAGVRAHPIAQTLGLPTTNAGRIIVDDGLEVPSQPDVFVIGDLAASLDVDETLVPQVAPGAIQGGQHVADTILARSRGVDDPPPFRYKDKGSMATIGRHAAVVELPNGLTITGFAGWVAWLTLHLYMLIGFRNRANVLVNWAWNYLTYDRGSRLIIELERAPSQLER